MRGMRHAQVTRIDLGRGRDVMRVYFRGVKGWDHRFVEVADPTLHEDTFCVGDIWDCDTRKLVSRIEQAPLRA